MSAMTLSQLDKRLLDEFQRGFPLAPRPFAVIAERLDSDEQTVIAALRRLAAAGLIDRVGAVLRPHRAGWSTLAAMAVPPERLEEVADLVSGFEAVNHNYEREHRLNLWFVVAAADRAAVEAVLAEIEAQSGIAVLNLPLVRAHHLDLGFPLQWA